MANLGSLLLAHCDEITARWEDALSEASQMHRGMPSPELRDHLPNQLRSIAGQLQDLDQALSPSELWRQEEELSAAARLEQEIPVEQLVKEYKIVLRTICEWITERKIQPTFAESSYLFEAIFALISENIRRYVNQQHEVVASERATYLAGISHQMRSPVSMLMMQAEMLSRAPDRAPEIACAIQRHAKRVLFLVNGVMRLERFKPHEIPVHPRSLHPSNLVDEVLDDRRLIAEPKGLRLESLVDRALTITADSELLTDALGNLVENAVKYTHAGFVRVQVEGDGDSVLFKVRDSGPGIPSEMRDMLFEQPVKPTERGGMGIGLYIAKRAVEAQEGRIGVESESGKGSLFWFSIPKCVGAQKDCAGGDHG